MNVLTDTLINCFTWQTKGQKEKLDQFEQWMEEVKLEDLQRALSYICGYDLTQFLGVIFGKEQKKILTPTPEVLKPYLEKAEISINEAKAYLVSLYTFKVALNAKRCGLITPDPIVGESIYSVLKAKMKSIIPSTDLSVINQPKSLSELVEAVSQHFFTKEFPYGVHLQREAKPIEIIKKEDLIGIFINHMSSRWVIKFMFSQGFLGISVLSLLQFALNSGRMVPLLRWAVGGFGVCTLIISVWLLILSIVCACQDLTDIDKVKGEYLKYLPKWLTAEALDRANKQIVPQYLSTVGEKSIKRKKENTLREEERLLSFLQVVRRDIQRINPLLNEDEVLQLLYKGLDGEHSWQSLREFLHSNIQDDILQIIDQVVVGKRSIAKKVNEARRLIKEKTIRISEEQIRQLLIEGMRVSRTWKQFHDFILRRVQELGLAKQESFIDRVANIFMFTG